MPRNHPSDAAGPERPVQTASGLAVRRTWHTQDPMEHRTGNPEPVEPQAAAKRRG